MQNLIGNVIASGSNIGRKIICLQGDKIENIRDVDNSDLVSPDTIDFGDCYISAGFIDLHINGAGDQIYQFCNSESAADKMFSAVARSGTAYFVPVISATNIEEYRRIRNFSRTLVRKRHQVLGLHFEGPFINEGKPGFGEKDCVGKNAIDSKDVYYDLLDDMKVMMTIAPEAIEYSDALQMIKDGVILSFGHTDSSAEACRLFVDLGVRYCTHLFNGMPAIAGRNPGLTGVCLSSDKVTASVILDGHHLANETLKLVWSMKRPDRVCVITDGMPPLYGEHSNFKYRDIEISEQQNGALLDSNESLSGTKVSQLQMLRNLIEVTGARIDKAVDTVTRAPAAVLGLENRIGDIRVGFDASFSVFTRDMKPKATILEGNVIWTD